MNKTTMIGSSTPAMRIGRKVSFELARPIAPESGWFAAVSPEAIDVNSLFGEDSRYEPVSSE